MTLETPSILLPAFITGLLVFSVHVPLGLEVLKRGIIFIDLAIAQIAALGVITAGLLAHEESLYMEQGLALFFALLGGAFFQFTERKAAKQQEAIIGASFVVASSLAILLVANSPHGSEEIEAMLVGQILWVSWQQIFTAAVIYVLVLALWFIGKGKRWFYYLFAVTITISVQLVGVYLVFASLILPALTATGRAKPLRCGYLAGFIALVVGLLLSVATDLPTGPLLVCVLAGITLLANLRRALSD
jgi:zinc/manganese transport system permease protein